jgi:hypothetical protein
MNESSHYIESLTTKISKLMKDIIIKQKKELLVSKNSEDKIIIKYRNINERLNNLHLSIIHLNSSLFIINDKILQDIKYLHTLEIIKPKFLHYVSQLHTNIDNSKNIVNNLVEGDDKEQLTNLLDKLKDHSSNITNILSNLFLQHYEKYKNIVNNYKNNYYITSKKMDSIIIKYNETKYMRDNILFEYHQIHDIITSMQKNYNLSRREYLLLQNLGKKINSILLHDKCHIDKYIPKDNKCASELLDFMKI